MSKRNQPYLPLYVQDFLTDEKLAECSAASTGVYIRLMCIMHKSEHYGKILLKQKYKQNEQQILNFATMIAKQFPYPFDIIVSSLCELLEENVLQIDGDFLIQKRMVKDSEISDKRSESGSKGGKKTANKNESFAKEFAKAKVQANSENEIDNDNDNTFINNSYSNNNNKDSNSENWFETKKQLVVDEQLHMKVCGTYGINKENLEVRLIDFIDMLELKEDFKSYKETKNHFINWVSKNIKEEKNKPYRDSTGTERANDYQKRKKLHTLRQELNLIDS
jgi:hypothetical protein